MKCKQCYYYPIENNHSTRGFLFPFVGGLLIGGLAAPLFIKNNNQYPPYYPSYPPNNSYYQYGYPVYQNYTSYTYPYTNSNYPY